MRQADSPTSTEEEFPAFLRHIATLLARGTSKDKEAKHVVAVTATIEESSMKTLIVAGENSPNASQNVFEDFKLEISTVKKNPQNLNEIYNSIGTAQTLDEYIGDLLGLFHSVDPDNADDKKKRWRSPLPDTLASWKPILGNEVEHFWVIKPDWQLEFGVEQNLSTRKRDVDGKLEWEFSFDTAHIWSTILSMLLRAINIQIKKYRSKPLKSRQQPLKYLEKDVEEIAYYYFTLFRLMAKYKRVVKALLAIPSLASSFQPAIKEPTDLITEVEDDEDELGLLPEPNESQADGVYRYLEGIVGWAAACYDFNLPNK